MESCRDIVAKGKE
jgi:hypothetical protein